MAVTIPTRPRSKVLLAIQITFTVICLYFVVRNVDWQTLMHSFAHVNVALLVGGVIVLALQPGIAALRWSVITSALGGKVSLRESAMLTYVSMFFNQALPASVGGDAIKILLMHRGHHPLRLAFNSTTLDRAAMLFGLLFIVLLCGAILHPALSGTAILPVLIAVAVIAGAIAVFAADRIPGRLLERRVFRILSAVAADIRLLLLNPVAMLKLIVLVALSYALMSISICVFVRALSEPLDLWVGLALVPAVLLASALPISVGGWGAREAAMIAILGTVGVSASGAVAASIIFGLSSAFVLAPGVIVYLFKYRATNSLAEGSKQKAGLQEI